jgi:hypothetical protein
MTAYYINMLTGDVADAGSWKGNFELNENRGGGIGEILKIIF